MTDVTRILSAIEQGDLHAAAQLLPLVYDAPHQLAGRQLAQEDNSRKSPSTESFFAERPVRTVGWQPAVLLPVEDSYATSS